MKQSIALLELIFSVFLLSIIMFFSLQFYTAIQQRNSSEFSVALSDLKLKNTETFIENILNTSEHITLNHSQIHFYKLDDEAFLQNYYSGVVVLDQSNQEKIYTPLSNATKLSSKWILFNQTVLYEFEKPTQNEWIYFKEAQSSKTLYEHYQIVKSFSSFYTQDENLYYDNHLLLEEVTSFAPLIQNGVLNIDICLKTQCQTWSFEL